MVIRLEREHPSSLLVHARPFILAITVGSRSKRRGHAAHIVLAENKQLRLLNLVGIDNGVPVARLRALRVKAAVPCRDEQAVIATDERSPRSCQARDRAQDAAVAGKVLTGVGRIVGVGFITDPNRS